MDGAHTKLVEAVGAGPVRADIYDGVKRHKKALREKAAVEAGRDPAVIGLEGRITWRGDLDHVRTEAEQWRAVGATHIAINTMGSKLGPVSAHLEVLATVAAALELG